jgi:hypothetical protein
LVWYQSIVTEADMGWGGKRPGSGRPKGSPSLKSEALAGRLDELGCDPAEALVRLGNKAEAAGDTELAVRAFTALMPFRWPKLKESSLDIGLGLSGSIADRLESARLRIEVTTGITRPPDEARVIDAAPAASDRAGQIDPAPPQPPTPSSPPKLRPVASPSPAPEPPAFATSGKAIPAHQYWAAKPER